MSTKLCGHDGCRLIFGHRGNHKRFPTEAWRFFEDRDKNKLTKAGFATPRGGNKGAYQNHVRRSNQVIIPFERLTEVTLSDYEHGYVIRLLPDQFFKGPRQPRPEFVSPTSAVRVGENAFVLYRTHESYERLPPLPQWEIRGLVTEQGESVKNRGVGIHDTGHYVVRLPSAGKTRLGLSLGPPQGIFAPEYATEELDYLSRCVLAWLTIHTHESPYTTSQAAHLKLILSDESLLDDSVWEFNGVMRHGISTCPLCTRTIQYEELHRMLDLTDEAVLANAALQVEGATRSTVVNLFHLLPMKYGRIDHVPSQVAWGHSICNTKLGQRRCFPLQELQETGSKVALVLEEGLETFGWISEDWEMIRLPMGSVWIRLCRDNPELGGVLEASDSPEELPITADNPLN